VRKKDIKMMGTMQKGKTIKLTKMALNCYDSDSSEKISWISPGDSQH
jgi:hypothetical protein